MKLHNDTTTSSKKSFDESNNPRMHLERLSLSFSGPDAPLERPFLESHRFRSLTHVRYALVLGAILVGVFGVLDGYLLPQRAHLLWFIRYAILCPGALLIALSTYRKSLVPYLHLLQVLMLILTASGFTVMIMFSPPPVNSLYYSGLMLVLIYGYTFLRLRFIWGTLAGWIIVGIYVFAAVQNHDIPMAVFINNVFFLVSANVIGMLASYSIEYYARNDFFLMTRMKEIQNKITDTNIILDSRVKERTTELQTFITKLNIEIDERRSFEDALRESETRLRHAETFARFGHWKLSLDDRMIELSDGAKNIYGFTKNKISLADVQGIALAEYRPMLRKTFKNILQQKKTIDIEFKIINIMSRHILDISSKAEYDAETNIFFGVVQDITQRKLAEKKLKEIITKNPMSIQILDRDGFTLEVNNSFKLLFGSAPPPGYSIFTDSQFAQQGLTEVFDKLRKGNIVRFPDVCFNPHDSISELSDVSVWTRTIGFPLNDSDDKPEQFVLMHENITERKHAEEALRESEEKYRSLFDANSDGIFIFYINEDDTISSIAIANNSAAKMLGYDLNEFIGRYPSEFERIKREDEIKERMDVLKTSGSANFETELLHKNGKIIQVEISAQVIHYYNRPAIMNIVRDITERKRTIDDLNKSEIKLRTVWENTIDAMRLADVSGTMVMVNDAFCLLFEKKREELEGKYISEIHHQDNRKVVLESYREVCRNRSVKQHYEGNIRLWNSKDIYVEGIHTFLEIPDQPLLLLSIFRNITERKQSEEALHMAQKMESIGTLAGGIAHDFNNLLNAILGQSSLAVGKLPKESPAVHNINKAIKASERAADLTRQLLAYSGRGKFFTVEIDINRLVQENVQMLQVSVPKTTHLQYELGLPAPHIHGDIGQIQQVIMNLIINAGEAIGPNPGIITVETGSIVMTDQHTEYWKYTVIPLTAGSYAMLKVKDTGSGISQETLKRIFDPFFTTKFTGRGLGLAAVLGIIKGHKGGLRIESEVGKGTTFEIVLPLIATSTKVDSEKLEKSLVVKGEGKTILIIDDDTFVFDLLEDVLHEVHFTVIGATDPVKGIELYRKEHKNISMVILDYSMPKMDGKKAFAELKKINPGVKVLLCSGYTEEETLSAFEFDLPAGFFQKPYKTDVFLERVSLILSNEN